jgi:hypothetical protein
VKRGKGMQCNLEREKNYYERVIIESAMLYAYAMYSCRYVIILLASAALYMMQFKWQPRPFHIHI